MSEYTGVALEVINEVNAWLDTHTPVDMNFQYTTAAIESDIEYILEHTLVLFFVERVDEL